MAGAGGGAGGAAAPAAGVRGPRHGGRGVARGSQVRPTWCPLPHCPGVFSLAEVLVPLVVLGGGLALQPGEREELLQVDVVPLLALLTGVPIPRAR